jgi:hypothetical protein
VSGATLDHAVDGRVVVLTYDRPEQRTRSAAKMHAALRDAWQRFRGLRERQPTAVRNSEARARTAAWASSLWRLMW